MKYYLFETTETINGKVAQKSVGPVSFSTRKIIGLKFNLTLNSENITVITFEDIKEFEKFRMYILSFLQVDEIKMTGPYLTLGEKEEE